MKGVKVDLGMFRHMDHRGERSGVLPEVNITEFARKVGVGRTHLSKVVNGMRPGRDLLFRLAKVMDMTVEEVDAGLDRLRKAKERGKRVAT